MQLRLTAQSVEVSRACNCGVKQNDWVHKALLSHNKVNHQLTNQEQQVHESVDQHESTREPAGYVTSL